MNKKTKTPFFHIVKRGEIPLWQSIAIHIGALVLALVVCSILTTLITGLNPIKVYATMFEGNFGTERKTWVMLHALAILLGISLALTPGYKMRFWNIGGEGQVLIGCMASGAVMHNHPEIPNALLLILMLVAAMAAGAIWGMIPAFFKAKWNTNETLFTLMMNYVAIQITAYFTIRWEVPKGSGKIGVINQNTMAGWLPKIADQQYLLTIIVVAALTIFMYFYLKYSKQGYEIAVVGESTDTARYAGINVKNVIIRTMCLSGAVCGLAGALIVSGASHTISTSTAGGRGFTAIIVAWMSKFNPAAMLIVSLFLVFMQQGSIQIATQFGLNENASDIITGILLFFLIGCEFFVNYKLSVYKEKEA